MTTPLKTLFLNPPSFEKFDGGASSRWPATREIESYWYPVWLTYPAGMLEGSRLLDAPPHHIRPFQMVWRSIHQARTLQHSGGIRQPDRVPIGLDLTGCRPAAAGATVKLFKGGRVQEQRLQRRCHYL